MLERHGAENFGTGWVKDRKAGITFRLYGRLIRFELPLATLEDAHAALRCRRFYRYKDPPGSVAKAWADQENRRRWRCLHLAIKAKLEAVATKIFTFEEEFLAHIVTSEGITIYETLRQAENGRGLLPAVGASVK